MAALCVLLAAACGYDYRFHKIPNYLIVMMAALGAGQRFLQEGGAGAAAYAGEACLILCLFYPLFKIGAIGAGDVKLLGTAAGYLPFDKILMFLCLSLLAAAAVSTVKMLRQGSFRERFRYLADYLKNTMESGSWGIYPEDEKKKTAGICLSGPILFGILLHVGGVY